MDTHHCFNQISHNFFTSRRHPTTTSTPSLLPLLDNEATYNGGRLSKLRVEIKPIQETVAGRSSRAGNDADDKEIKDIVQGIKLNEVPSKPSNNVCSICFFGRLFYVDCCC